MTLDEAIKHCEDVAAKCFVERSARNHSGKCGFEHLELAAWLRELKAYKEQQPCEDAISRADVKKYLSASNENGDRVIYESDLDLLPPVIPKQKWISVKFRPLTDEEQKEYPDYCYMADCPMPDDGEEILVSTKSGRVEKDECGFDDGYYLDSGYDWQTDIVAWMPLPEPYKAESEGER